MLENDEFRIWLNAPVPVPGTTISSCYPHQFMSSFLLQTGGISQAPFEPLVCPEGYTTQGPFTSNYIACCPSGWDGFAPAASPPPKRPAFGGTCFKNIYNVPIQITSYDKSAIKASSIFTATGTSDQAFAYPYEGFALGVAVLASTTGSSQAAASEKASTPFQETDAGSGGMTHGAVAGLVLGCIITVLLLVALVVFALNYRHKRLMDRRMQFSFYDSHIRLADSPTPMMFMDPNERGSPDTGFYSNTAGYDIKKIPVEMETPRPRTIYEMEAAPLPATKTKQLPDLPRDLKSP
ncbi:hypothetical protein N431DRAFT_436593 [Stipitochalara longipes BDJ]|nr:hypothetical protein N431DRAFT_436593 [Stipitochalara longipes BDJ]